MLLSLALICLLGLICKSIAKYLRIPNLIAYLLLGMLLGPYGLNLLASNLLAISSELRQMILILILARAGLSFTLGELRQVGRPAILLSFLPATFEIVGAILILPHFFPISLTEAALLGSVLGAVSPAVVVPRMIHLIDEGYGTQAGIPQMLLAGASMDDIYCLVMFSSFLSLVQHGQNLSWSSLGQLGRVPLAILSGILLGALVAFAIKPIFLRLKTTSEQTLLILATGLLLVSFEKMLPNIPYSGILAVMTLAILLHQKATKPALAVKTQLDKIWQIGEIFLFTLVGASVNLPYAIKAGWTSVIVIFLILLVRILGVAACLSKTSFNLKERAFCLIAYLPKATVQAAIGGLPLAMGLASGELILTLSVVAILVTAPLGALGIDLTYRKWLKGHKALKIGVND